MKRRQTSWAGSRAVRAPGVPPKNARVPRESQYLDACPIEGIQWLVNVNHQNSNIQGPAALFRQMGNPKHFSSFLSPAQPPSG